jgi:4-amino-4-deoxy-L-arabinose transferase-like glycosyltransferase
MDERLRWRDALAVFLVAAGMRALYLIEASRFPDFHLFYLDQEYHLEWARSLVSGVWTAPYSLLAGAPFFRAPLYPYFLAGLFHLFGPSPLAARIVQLVIGSASCALVYAVGGKCFGRRAGLVAGALCAVYWVLVYFDETLLLPVLLVFLVLLGFLLAFLAIERRSALLAAASGLGFGLYAITRPNVLVFLPFAAWWMGSAARRAAPRRAALFVLLFAALCAAPPAAVTVRNRLVGHDWVFVSSQGGVNFYIGNNERSDGVEAVVPGTRLTWWGGYEDTVDIAERAAGRTLKPSEVSAYWFGRAFAFIRESPGRWLGLTFRKALILVDDPEISNNEPYEARRARYWTFRFVPLSFAVFLGLFLVSLPRFLRPRPSERERRPGGSVWSRCGSLVLVFLVVYGLSVIAFFVTGRYRVPLVPFLAVGAGVSVVTIADLFRAGEVRRAVVMVAVAAALVGVLKVDYLGTRSANRGFVEFTEAQDLLAAGDADGAIDALERVRAEGSLDVPELYQALARAYVSRGRPQDAAAILATAEAGLSEWPRDPELLWYAMMGSFQLGDLDRARDIAARYLAVRPDDIRALYMATGIALARGDDADARALLARAEALDPSNPLVARMRQQIENP